MTSQPATITNYSTLIFLINPKTRALKAVYEPDSDGKSDPDTKSKREIFKTFDPSIVVGDYLVVPSDTRLKFTTVRVVEVDVQVELDTTANVRWVVGKIDTAPFDELKRGEDQAINRVKSAKANAAREQLRKELLADVDTAALGTLQIASMGIDLTKPQTPGT